MKKSALRVVIGLAALCTIGFLILQTVSTSPTVSAMRDTGRERGDSDRVVVACPGRVEGQSDTIEVGAATDGIVQSVNVHEGEVVPQGAVLAQIGCSDLHSSLQVAEAEAESVKQSRARLLRGSRPEERDAAAQRTQAARAEVDHASVELDRARQLSAALAISKSAYDKALRDYDVAEAELKEASRNEELTDAGPTKEDAARADADLLAAQERIKLAQQRIGKCTVTAPVKGTILRVDLRPGEAFSTVAPHPLFTISDLTGRRVRAEVDERDIGKVQVGQKTILTSEAYPGMRFTGRVERISSMMGRKTVNTGNPADKSDRDILEALVDLDPAAKELPMGLRVTVQFVR